MAPAGSPVGGVVLVHGLGDHVERYREVAAVFAARGFQVGGVDLPGHGASPGARGRVEGAEAVETVIHESVARLGELLGQGARLGVAAHSMGAFFVLRLLQQEPDLFEFAWLSSPLVRPGEHRSRVVREILRVAARFFPGLTVSSKIRPELCRRRRGEDDDDALIHHRVSLSLGAALLDMEEAVARGVSAMNPLLALLVTHGEEDQICPARYSRELFDAMNLENKRYLLLPDHMHEPFRDEGSEEVLAAVGRWLDGLG
ncbi:MAG: alpha/beta fold hydrolase [Verrucomicrobiales bacterium]